jgi:hypothetical protein
MADRQRVYEGRPGLSEWGEGLGELNPRVLRAVRAGAKANVMPGPSGVPFAGLLESTKSLPALPHFLGDLLTGGKYGLSERAPEFALEASEKYDELINKYLAEEGLADSAQLSTLEKYGLAAGEMFGQLPVPGRLLQRVTKKLPKAAKPAGWLAEYFGPTVEPKAVNYAVGTGIGGTLRTVTGEEPQEFARGGLGRKSIVRKTEEGVTEVLPPKLAGTEIMKEPGGNWLPGTVERFVDGIRREFVQVNERPVERLRRLEDAMAKDPENVNLEAHEGLFAREKARLEAQIPVDRWLEKKLTNYIKNDAATERDPVRLGIEQRVVKANAERAKTDQRIAKQQEKITQAKAAGRDTTAAEDRLSLEMADLEQKYALDKQAAGVPPIDLEMRNIAVSNRTSNLFPEARPYATTLQSQDWEDMMDYMIEPHTAGGLWENRSRRGENLVQDAPWLAKVPPETPVYELYGDPTYFAHLRDELYNSVRTGSDIPPELKLSADDLEKMNVDAVVAHVGKVDAWRERNRTAANLARSNNPAVFTVKEYPGTGLEWKQLKMPEPKLAEGETIRHLPEVDMWGVYDPRGGAISSGATEKEALGLLRREERRSDLQKALDYEGSVMGHCVDGYCDPVMTGQTQIFSLRDAKGEPHVTIEVKPGNVAYAVGDLPPEQRFALTQEVKDRYFGGVMPGRSNEPEFFQFIDQTYVEKYGKPPSDIVQIKGKGNKKPADKYIPYVQDFVKSGDFGQIKDFFNTDLLRIGPNSPFADEFRKAGRQPPKYVTQREMDVLDQWFNVDRLQGQPLPEFADGGAVESEEYDEAEIDKIVAPLRAKFEGYLGEAKKLPRKAKQAVANVTEIGDIIKRSKEIPLEYYDPKGEVAGEADAMRHLLFQAQLQQKYGEFPAKAIGYVHEYTSPGQPSAEREMDLINDELGREIGRSAKSEQELIEMARRYIESGRAKTLPKEQRGGY